MEVNWEKTMAFALESLSSMSAIVSRSASILVLLWNSPVPRRVRMLPRLLPSRLPCAACVHMTRCQPRHHLVHVSRSASILVLLLNSPVPRRVRMLPRLLPRRLPCAACVQQNSKI